MSFKEKFDVLKNKAQQHAPVVISGAVALAATIAAAYYRNELSKSNDYGIFRSSVGSERWPTIEIHPIAFREVVEDGATLMYRASTVNGHTLTQATTQGSFPAEADESFEAHKNS